jgi:hypothetical protein
MKKGRQRSGKHASHGKNPILFGQGRGVEGHFKPHAIRVIGGELHDAERSGLQP